METSSAPREQQQRASAARTAVSQGRQPQAADRSHAVTAPFDAVGGPAGTKRKRGGAAAGDAHGISAPSPANPGPQPAGQMDVDVAAEAPYRRREITAELKSSVTSMPAPALDHLLRVFLGYTLPPCCIVRHVESSVEKKQAHCVGGHVATDQTPKRKKGRGKKATDKKARDENYMPTPSDSPVQEVADRQGGSTGFSSPPPEAESATPVPCAGVEVSGATALTTFAAHPTDAPAAPESPPGPPQEEPAAQAQAGATPVLTSPSSAVRLPVDQDGLAGQATTIRGCNGRGLRAIHAASDVGPAQPTTSTTSLANVIVNHTTLLGAAPSCLKYEAAIGMPGLNLGVADVRAYEQPQGQNAFNPQGYTGISFEAPSGTPAQQWDVTVPLPCFPGFPLGAGHMHPMCLDNSKAALGYVPLEQEPWSSWSYEQQQHLGTLHQQFPSPDDPMAGGPDGTPGELTGDVTATQSRMPAFFPGWSGGDCLP